MVIPVTKLLLGLVLATPLSMSNALRVLALFPRVLVVTLDPQLPLAGATYHCR